MSKMTISSDTFMTVLEQFAGREGSSREEAFSKLAVRCRPYLHSLVSRSLSSPSDCDDVIQEVLQRLWKSRDKAGFATAGAFWRFLRTLARNCTIDHLRLVEPALNLDDHEWVEILPDEHDQVDLLVEAIEDRRVLYRLADEVFLKARPEINDRMQTRRLLAAKLFLIDKLPWQTVIRIVNSGAYDDEFIGRTELDDLLTDESVLKQLAFRELHWENSRLSSFLIDTANSGPKPLTADEVLAVQMRFQYAMLYDQIANRMESRLKKSELTEVFDSCVQRFPFVEIMNRLVKDVGQVTDARKLFKDAGLWNRLVFQYFCHDTLPHRDIYDRTASAAKIVGHEITLGKLNVGLSNGRLFKKLAEHLALKEGK